MYSTMAGIIQRANKWVAVYRDASGKEIRKTTGISILPKVLAPGTSKKKAMEQTRAMARLVADEMEKACRCGFMDTEKIKAIAGGDIASAVSKSALGVRSYMREWLESRRGKKGAFERDGKAVRQFLSFLGASREEMPMNAVSRGIAEEWMEKELERVASGTVERYLASLSAAFTAACRKEIIARNPFAGVRPSRLNRTDKQERGAFTADEVRRMVEVFPDEWPDMILVCLYTGGQRLGDIASMRWDQINLNDQILAMTTQKSKRRMVKPIIAPLKDLLERRGELRVNDFVFPISAMKYMNQGMKSSKLSLEFTSLLREHGFIEPQRGTTEGDRRVLSEKSFHSLRATAVTMLRLAGVPADLCRFIVGHDSEEIERVYMRPQLEDISKAMEHISNEVGRSEAGE